MKREILFVRNGFTRAHNNVDGEASDIFQLAVHSDQKMRSPRFLKPYKKLGLRI